MARKSDWEDLILLQISLSTLASAFQRRPVSIVCPSPSNLLLLFDFLHTRHCSRAILHHRLFFGAAQETSICAEKVCKISNRSRSADLRILPTSVFDGVFFYKLNLLWSSLPFTELTKCGIDILTK